MTPSELDRTYTLSVDSGTEPRPQMTCTEIFTKCGRVWFLDMRADRQTDRLVAIARMLSGRVVDNNSNSIRSELLAALFPDVTNERNTL